MAFIFYDTETTGIETAFDQILQFGAIKTDDDLNELDRFEIKCRLQPHVVPAPGALLTTGMTPAQLLDETLPTHYEMVREIRKKLNTWGPARYIGYNSISFDEELLRHAFYQTLHPLYLTNTHGNSRGDAMNMVHGIHVHHSSLLRIPINAKGKHSFKLDQLAPANGFAHARAHDAIGDVEAVIFLCKRIQVLAPDYWSAMLNTMSKRDVANICEQTEFLHYTGVYYGRFYSYVLMFCAEANGAMFCFDMAHDPIKHVNASPDLVVKQMEGQPKLLRRLFPNKHPILVPLSAQEAAQKLDGVSPEELLRRMAVLRDNETYRKSIHEAAALVASTNVTEEGPVLLESRIHDGFPLAADVEQMHEFHEAGDWVKRTAIARRIGDERSKEMAYRLIFQHAPEALPAEVSQRMQKWRRDRLLSEDPAVPWTTISKAKRELEALADRDHPLDIETLKDLRCFYETLEASI